MCCLIQVMAGPVRNVWAEAEQPLPRPQQGTWCTWRADAIFPRDFQKCKDCRWWQKAGSTRASPWHHIHTWILWRTRLARFPKSILGAGTTALRFGNSTKQGFDTLASLVSTVACAPHVCVYTGRSICHHTIASNRWEPPRSKLKLVLFSHCPCSNS